MVFPRKLAVVALAGAVGLSGCATTDGGWSGQKTVSTVLGAVGGALIANQIGSGSGRTVATILGALSGGALGEWIGSLLDDKDKQALAASTQQALASGQTVQWKSDHSDASAAIRTISSKTVEQQAQVKRSPVIAKANNLAVLNQPYRATRSANLRAAPATNAAKVGGFRARQSFTALGKTPNDWVAVGRKGVLVGYVYAPLVAPVAQAQADAATDLDSITVAQADSQGFDLDALEPARPVTEQVAVQTVCRTMQYDVATAQGQESKTVDACQTADGAWDIG